MFKAMTASVALSFVSIGTVFAAPPTLTAQTVKGQTLVDTKGMTLYTFVKDANGKSACNGPCAVNWPPLMADGNSEMPPRFSVIARDDGAKQVAYDGKPLYTFAKDKNPGDINGDGFLQGAWHVAQP